MSTRLSRRKFVNSSMAAASLLPVFNVLARKVQTIGPDDDQVNVALVGYGRAGEILTDGIMKIPGVRIKAVCDIWTWRQKIARGRLRAMGHPVNVYEDYREMLEAEGDKVDCVIVSVPDWMHREIACAAMEAGKHVYCEAPCPTVFKMRVSW